MPRDKQPGSRLEIFGWCMFDFANSSYTTLIITFAYPLYFRDVVAHGAGLEPDRGTSLFNIGASAAQAVVLVTAPLVGAITDFSGAKKRFLFVSYLGCILLTACLGLVGPGDLWLGLGFFILSNVFYSSGENLVAAFLPEIARPEAMGRVSGQGWALGYVGGLASLGACYPFLAGEIDTEHSGSVRWSFVVVGLFFLLAGLPTFLFLRERGVREELSPGRGYISVGFSRVFETLQHVRMYRQLFRFLIVFFVYTCGVNIVVNNAIIFAKSEIEMPFKDLIALFAVLQLSGSAGALLFGAIQDRWSSRAAVQLSLALWIVACIGGFFTYTKWAFTAVGAVTGIAMGSAQSAGRALVATFSPEGRSGEFLGFWGLFWKLSGVVGPLAFASVIETIGMRNSILATSVFFVAGILGMRFIDEDEGRRAAREVSEETARTG